MSEIIKEQDADRRNQIIGGDQAALTSPDLDPNRDQKVQGTPSPAEIPSPETEAGVEPLAADPPGQSTGVKTPEKMSTQLPTMWMGAQNGYLYVHSSKADWSTCILKVGRSRNLFCI